MVKLLFMILVSFDVTTKFLFGEITCTHYNDKGCTLPKTIKNGYYVNQWSVYLPGVPKEEARQILEENGFVYLGQLMAGADLHLVTKENTFQKHSMPNKQIIRMLKKINKVKSVAQKHIIQNSPDEVFSVLDAEEVNCMSIDPNLIRLNDGRENLERIQTAEDIIANTAIDTARPISSLNTSDSEDELDDEEMENEDDEHFDIDEDEDEDNYNDDDNDNNNQNDEIGNDGKNDNNGNSLDDQTPLKLPN